MHIVTFSIYFDSNRTAALKRGLCEKRLIFKNFSCNLSISLTQNISVLDKSRKLGSCVRVDIQSFIDARGLLLIGRKGMHCAEVYMCLEQNVVFMCQLPRKHADIFKTLFYLKKLSLI